MVKIKIPISSCSVGVGAPPFRRVEELIRQKISDGMWKPGNVIPNRRDLAKEYGVAINTVNHAVEELVDQGLLTTVNRHGTFVSAASPVQSRDSSFEKVENMRGHATVGILACLPENYSDEEWGSQSVNSLESTFSELGVRTHLFPTPFGRDDAMAEAIESALGAGVDGIVASYFLECKPWIDAINSTRLKTEIPMAIVSTEVLPYPITHTFIDEETGGYLAAEHLVKSGYKRNNFLVPFMPPPWLQRRIDGAAQALSSTSNFNKREFVLGPGKNPLSWDSWVGASGDPPEQRRIFKLFQSALENRADGPFGLIVPNDHVGVIIVRRILEMGMELGKDVGVVSFDASPEGAKLGITSMRQPIGGMAVAAARAVAGALQGLPMPAKLSFLPKLILRNSTQPKPSARIA